MLLRIIAMGVRGSLCSSQLMMGVRKVKPAKVETGLREKLKSSNFIGKFDEAISGRVEAEPLTAVLNKQKGQGRPKTKKKSNRNRISDVPAEIQAKQQSIKSKQAPTMQKALAKLGEALQPINTKALSKISIEQAAALQSNQLQQAITMMKALNLKDFSVLVHKLLVNSSGVINTNQKYIWKEIQQNFLARFEPTTDPTIIRSYSKVVYSLAKSKVHKDNSSTLVSTSVSTNLQSLETKFALLLPSATHQSFATIVTSLSRMGPLTQQFCYITQRLYYQKYSEFNVRERVQINYALTRNGNQVDSKLQQCIPSMNLKQIVLMLRCYDNCGRLTSSLLSFAQKNIIVRKKQMNAIDIGDICALYFEATCRNYLLSQELESTLTQMYLLLKKNIDEVTLEKILRDLPTVINRGHLQVSFMEQIIKTIKILRKKDAFPQRIWKPMRETFKKFKNLQIRTRLQQIQ